MAISTIANGGRACKPHILSDGSGSENSQCTDLKIKKENIDLVKNGMVGACTSGGTGYPFFNFNIAGLPAGRQVACKTGTAETGINNKTHAWFTVFAPVDNPEIITTVLVEEGGEGSSVAGPIAKQIFDFWFQNRN
jgi:penicillin-binding protein 2